jgi:hypothetical protein
VHGTLDSTRSAVEAAGCRKGDLVRMTFHGLRIEDNCGAGLRVRGMVQLGGSAAAAPASSPAPSVRMVSDELDMADEALSGGRLVALGNYPDIDLTQMGEIGMDTPQEEASAGATATQT